jgi:UDP-glucose 6-dehydrogenase
MNISIIGAGYVGLVTGAGFASKGHEVVCIDLDESKVSLINQGKSPIYENSLNKLLLTYIEKRILKVSLSYEEILNPDITFICVNTPSDSAGAINLINI